MAWSLTYICTPILHTDKSVKPCSKTDYFFIDTSMVMTFGKLKMYKYNYSLNENFDMEQQPYDER